MAEQEEERSIVFQPLGAEGRWFFETDLFILQIQAKLEGGTVVEKGKGFTIQHPLSAKPYMNQIGIDETIAQMRLLISKVQSLSVMGEERVLEWCKEIHIELARFFYVNMRRFELSPSKMKILMRSIMNLVELNMRRSIEGNGLRAITASEKVVVTEDNRPRSSGLLARVKATLGG